MAYSISMDCLNPASSPPDTENRGHSQKRILPSGSKTQATLFLFKSVYRGVNI
ncbi:hypothetical protein MA16_Dca009689 [Dendrobium catenatum]|uniref:Uncharacterized protein n=1 Tax=Dendrobium catenatum TaxID=906689 RepID=A0A2I0VQH0_9ASPA|nr:hypothetical protein MA16_Dca009689 [Dendrobium catenatum]